MEKTFSTKIYDGQYFEIVNSEGDILVVRCNLCGSDGSENQLLRTSTKSNGNILKHIKRRHLAFMDKIKLEKGIRSRQSRGSKGPDQLINGKWMGKLEFKQEKAIKGDPVPSAMEEDNNESNTGQIEFFGGVNDQNNENNEQMYVIEPIPQELDSDDEDYIEFELEANRGDDRTHDLTNDDTYGIMGAQEQEFNTELTKKRKLTKMFNPLESTSKAATATDRSLIEFQKKLMQMEFDEIRKCRTEKHQLEVAILKAELAHKTIEHQKRMEILSKKLNES